MEMRPCGTRQEQQHRRRCCRQAEADEGGAMQARRDAVRTAVLYTPRGVEESPKGFPHSASSPPSLAQHLASEVASVKHQRCQDEARCRPLECWTSPPPNAAPGRQDLSANESAMGGQLY
ncbi:hypothetical protein U9M48_000362 [Paspalum notatum var. saurae]|uniref:Uncharacterized protein n=1 Tax=Paspalum notatum var. saurae TaxID=547442 RepID=A0AAQ3SFX0_PASNO